MLFVLQTAFLGEGIDADYVVSDLFSGDFKFNRFNTTSSVLTAGTVTHGMPNPQLAASRRRLDERTLGDGPAWVRVFGYQTLLQ